MNDLPTTATLPSTPNARAALELVSDLQAQLAEALIHATEALDPSPFVRVAWTRDGGTHGGGWRLAKRLTPSFNRASINVSAVHYDDLPHKQLSSATAISTIIHPTPALSPSMHMHISWTERRDGTGYWRMMGDLNPSNPVEEDKTRFEEALDEALGELAAEAKKQGDAYFYIPSLDRHRGVSHYYLETFNSGDFAQDLALARRFGEALIDAYAELLRHSLGRHVSHETRANQLAYHSVYLLQVLTLDRGTTSGLLVHDQNDVGILGSIPSFVDRELIATWIPRQTAPQDALLEAIVAELPPADEELDDAHRAKLAQVVRAHFKAHPEALELQASGGIVPPTVQNHS